MNLTELKACQDAIDERVSTAFGKGFRFYDLVEYNYKYSVGRILTVWDVMDINGRYIFTVNAVWDMVAEEISRFFIQAGA